ncbi:GreA/GreB family elongation factor [Bradyrhizobium sp. ISRA443]|uniref:GreA/GreB family elongation factor n=1 Tax=unclassified Bradyrhizobium TaxID=2631580 RepID=UPI0024795950|nr:MULTISPECIES: GreA/GreB family elongation factor [unclassified Bradyrhizobium]WGR93684.1 GreA/GreB family elongation factor [Bradyrhizobium sp. ISRA435]WGR98260.1 GreA/GreB family elongation factor [Bradyrhizobium sp. ISRA436]WGS05148.1 GreA/GreB family elongation factor [Bradyrhizobium sp. ISRA437]WGS12034.1 GreA/GreB family elongation factor [Bradyrhizobium sp. ISRA443]
MLPLPKITITASDYPRLEHIARVASRQGNADATFLMGEIDRAEIVPGDARDIETVVTIESWVTYWMNWPGPRNTVQLVWPEERTSDPAQISVLSPLGAALIGLRVGDQMPYFVAGCMNVVRVESVGRPEPILGKLFRKPGCANDQPADDDPGPTAA